ncbi:hypothetical protein NMG60_11034438 [Bertholletia excelsa]
MASLQAAQEPAEEVTIEGPEEKLEMKPVTEETLLSPPAQYDVAPGQPETPELTKTAVLDEDKENLDTPELDEGEEPEVPAEPAGDYADQASGKIEQNEEEAEEEEDDDKAE